MEYVVYIVFGIIIVVLLILMYQMSLYNKINDSKIRIEESSSRIDIDLKDKLDLFNQVITISKEEEEETLELASFGDEIAKNKLIEHNLRLVVFLAKKYENTNIDLEDLVSIGTIGLIKGIDSFSKSNGAKITTYCARCIENAHLT